MADIWPGIVVRCRTGENGTVPRAPSDQSPDIIISGIVPFENPGFLTDPANYDNAFSANLTIGVPNWIYVRGKDFTTAELSGSWNLFWATKELLLYPGLWEKNQLAASSTNKDPPFTIGAGKIGASTDSFAWVPPDTSGEYCLIAVANTPGYGNPLAGVPSVPSLAPALELNGNFALRDVNMVRGPIPDIVGQV